MANPNYSVPCCTCLAVGDVTARLPARSWNRLVFLAAVDQAASVPATMLGMLLLGTVLLLKGTQLVICSKIMVTYSPERVSVSGIVRAAVALPTFPFLDKLLIHVISDIFVVDDRIEKVVFVFIFVMLFLNFA